MESQRIAIATRRIVVGSLVVALAATSVAPTFAGSPHRAPHASAQRQAQDVTSAKKGGKTKTVKKTFSNAESVVIPAESAVDDFGPADVYPSTITVKGFKKAKITDVNLTLRGFSHTFPLDVDIMLVAPGSRNAVVMSDVGGNVADAAVTDLTLTLDDEAAAFLPAEVPLTRGTFKPFDDAANDVFPAPAPTPSGNTTLSSFDGINPNGEWQLFIVDDSSEDAGSLDDGWTLEITAKSKTKGRKH